ncbi:DUF4974 domain-containing protein [Sphingobacterium psychroaquaticum]|uniref:FecR family protein n=1 Tax=Sphingobacterium psychroaquaticum TaxID=561061 RepID=UPI00106BB36E|nr:FecR domain-containing protein [Sphingobacterium psychroaquaticum]QBQ42092.1 DUF4974 domain-containing protein [Sphingobacterium psychroaquaticum]
MLTIEYTVQLLKAYVEGRIHPDTHIELRQLFEQHPELFVQVDRLTDPTHLEAVLLDYKQLYAPAYRKQEQRVLDRIFTQINEEQVVRYKKRKRLFVRYAAAASVVFVLGVGLWKFTYKPTYTEAQVLEKAQDFIPGGNRATLTTSDGTRLDLNEERLGIVMGGDIKYDDGSVLLADAESKATFLTLSTPKGGQYQVVLSDGTKVWLNAASSLRYPKVFGTQQRMVFVEGEAYFEVAKNKQKPFVVQTDKEKVEVLGTHFNVNSYTEEKESKVSLIEGRVKVSVDGMRETLLDPGHQSVVSGQRIRVQEFNVEESMAWKNGEFMFNNENLGTALRQVERWYDVDIQVDPQLAQINLWGTVSRMETFDKVLKVIKMTDDNIKIKLDGRRVRLMK